LRRKYLELPIVLFEVSKVVPSLSDFEHIQKLTANFRSLKSAQKNPGLTELAQVAMRRHLPDKLTRRLNSANKIYPVTVSREGRYIGRMVNQLPPSSLSTQLRTTASVFAPINLCETSCQLEMMFSIGGLAAATNSPRILWFSGATLNLTV
jgi:hypothetical protein